MESTAVLKSLSEQELRDRLDELEQERKATMVLLRAKRAMTAADARASQSDGKEPQQ